MRQRHQIQIANFDMASLRVIWVSLGPLVGCRNMKQVEPRARDATARNMVVRQTVQHVPCFRRFSRSEYCSEPLPLPGLLLPKGFGLYACPLCRFPLLLICPHSVKLFGNLHSQVSVEVSITGFLTQSLRLTKSTVTLNSGNTFIAIRRCGAPMPSSSNRFTHTPGYGGGM
jgi:hypothetical protein